MLEAVPATMRASVLAGKQQIVTEERPVPRPAAGDVLIRVRAVGVCGSDVHYYQDGRIGDLVVDRPLVLGHEASGVVADVGADVPGDRIGERVAIDPQRPCRRCSYCKTGRLNLCPRMQFYATPPIDGAFCDYVTAPADFTYRVPDTMSDNTAALLEPFSVGLWACGKAVLYPGARVLISGAGPIGTLTCIAARHYGATEVIVSDPVLARRERIMGFGATAVHDPTELDAHAGELRADAFIECSGATPAMLTGLRAVRRGGTAVMVGLGAEHMSLPVQYIATNEITVTGVFRYVNTWPQALAVASQPGADLDALVTREFLLEQTEEALMNDADPQNMKSMVVVGS